MLDFFIRSVLPSFNTVGSSLCDPYCIGYAFKSPQIQYSIDLCYFRTFFTIYTIRYTPYT